MHVCVTIDICITFNINLHVYCVIIFSEAPCGEKISELFRLENASNLTQELLYDKFCQIIC